MQQPWGPIFLSPYRSYDLQTGACHVTYRVEEEKETMTVERFEEIIKENPRYLPFFGGRIGWTVMDVLLLMENPRLDLIQHFLTAFPSIPSERIVNNVSDFKYRTPLMLAVRHPNKDLRKPLVELFLQHGGNLNYCNFFSLTPLSSAIKKGDFDLIDFLLGKGAVFPAGIEDIHERPYEDPYYDHGDHVEHHLYEDEPDDIFVKVWKPIIPSPPSLQKLITDVIRREKIDYDDLPPTAKSFVDYHAVK